MTAEKQAVMAELISFALCARGWEQLATLGIWKSTTEEAPLFNGQITPKSGISTHRLEENTYCAFQ